MSYDLQKILERNPDLVPLNGHLLPKPRAQAEATETPKRPDTELESKFLSHWNLLTGKEPLLRDFVFAPDAKGYEIDAYHEGARVGIEVNGGTWAVGGHSTGTGIGRDYRKQLLAATRGILILPVSSDMLTQKEIVLTIDQIWRVIKSRCK